MLGKRKLLATVMALIMLFGMLSPGPSAVFAQEAEEEQILITMPDVVGMTEKDAIEALTALGLQLGEVNTEYDETLPSGQVVCQNPAAGTEVEPESAVDFVVSGGPAPVQEEEEQEREKEKVKEETKEEVLNLGLPIVLNYNPDDFADGDGSPETPFLIETAGHLNNVRNYLGNEHTDKHFRLIANIDLDTTPYNQGEGWMPIGSYGSSFTGSFDGNGKTIGGLYINRPNTSYVGLFGSINNAFIKDLTLEGVNITGKDHVGSLTGHSGSSIISRSCASGTVSGTEFDVGGLVGYNDKGTVNNSSAAVTVTNNSIHTGGLVGRSSDGTLTDSYATGVVIVANDRAGGLVGQLYRGEVSRCYATGSVTGRAYIGGLVGDVFAATASDATITNCHAEGAVTGNTSNNITADFVGGLVGSNTGGIISASYATGNVKGNDSVGGLVGRTVLNSTFTNCHATGNVTGRLSVGGLAGECSNATIIKCYAEGAVTGNDDTSTADYVGGLVGNNSNGSISTSYATGNVEGSDYVGGLVGFNAVAPISNSYARGNVTGSNYIGGLVGGIGYSLIINSYATGHVRGDGAVGGLLGGDKYENSNPCENCYYDMETTGQSDTGKGTPKSTAEMKKQLTFNPEPGAGWNFENIWAIQEDVTYPYFSWQIPPEPPPITSNIIYVKHNATGANNGTSWADAFTTLQTALDAVGTFGYEDVTQIWVAKGTYYPTSHYGLGGGDRSKHFRMKNGVAIYGGLAGDESPDYDLELRDFDVNKTTLNGDIGTPGDNSDNCYHVFYHPSTPILTNTAVLDGFTITGGNANDSNTLGDHSRGGGMYNGGEDANPKLNNVTFSDNTATFGGGMYNVDGSSTLNNVTFNGNTAANGGGMYNNSGSPTLNNVTFSGNTSNLSGGGMHNTNGNPELNNVTFNGNQANSWGGGMYNDSGPSGHPNLNNVTFNNNKANLRGGGMYNFCGNPELINVTFKNNTTLNGGGMSNESGNPSLINVVFSGNQANNGGGINHSFGSPIFTNVTFYGNEANNRGGGIYYADAENNDCVVLTNSILWGNTAPEGPQIINVKDRTIDISYNLIQGCGGSENWDSSLGNDLGGNIDADPLFVDAANGNLRLQPGSPAIDKGDNSAVPFGITTDLEGNPRIVSDTVDMGAYEYQEDAGPPALAITTTSLPDGTVNSLYIFTLKAGGGTESYTWSADGLPDNLSIESSTGTISGTPTVAGTSTVTATVYDDAGADASRVFYLTVDPESSAKIMRSNPLVAYGGSNGFLVVWWETDYDMDNNNFIIAGQRIDLAGNLIGDTVVITGPVENAAVWPSVAYDETNQVYLVVWEDAREFESTQCDIIGRFMNAKTGQLIGDSFAVCDDEYDQHYPEVAYNSTSGNFMVVWQENDEALCNFGRLVSYNIHTHQGNLLGDGKILLGSDEAEFTGALGVIDSNPGSKFFVFWGDYRSSTNSICGRFVDAESGMLLGSGDIIIHSDEDRQYFSPTAAAGDGKVFVTWEDSSYVEPPLYKRYSGIYGRYLDVNSMEPIGISFVVADEPLINESEPSNTYNSISSNFFTAFESSGNICFIVLGADNVTLTPGSPLTIAGNPTAPTGDMEFPCSVYDPINKRYFVVYAAEIVGDKPLSNIKGVLVATDESSVPTTYSVTVLANPVAGGSVLGGGTYSESAPVTVSASAKSGYHFVNWTEGVTMVSTNASYSFTMGTANRTLVANFEEDAPLLTITTDSLPNGTVGTSYTTALTASGGTPHYTWSGSDLPAGLSMNASSGEITGTPTASGTFTVTVTVTDNADASTSKELGLIIKSSGPSHSGGGGGGGGSSPAPAALVQKIIKLTIGKLEAYIDNQKYMLDAAPYIEVETSRTLVPLRFVSEALGAKVDWDGELKQITITDGSRTIILSIGSHEALVDGIKVSLDCAPVIIQPGRTMVPLRFVSENLGAQVEYDEATKVITIIK